VQEWRVSDLQNISLEVRLRVAHPCAQSRSTVHPEHNGPESRHHTPLTTIVLSEHFNGNTIGVSRAGVNSACQDRERQGSRARAHTDVLVASPEVRYRTTSDPKLISSIGPWGYANNFLIIYLQTYSGAHFVSSFLASSITWVSSTSC
jgi:hypothetical protein